MSKPKFPPRNPIPKTFTAIVPLSLKAASETYQFAPAVRIGIQHRPLARIWSTRTILGSDFGHISGLGVEPP